MRTRDPYGRSPSRDEARATRTTRLLRIRAYLRACVPLPQRIDEAQRRAARERARDRLRVRDAARTRTEERRRHGNDHRVRLARCDHVACGRLPRKHRAEQLRHRFPARVLHVDDPSAKRPAVRTEPDDALGSIRVATSMRDRRRSRAASRAPRPRAVGHEARAAQRLGGNGKPPAEQLVDDGLELPQKHRHRASVGAVTGGSGVSCGISGAFVARSAAPRARRQPSGRRPTAQRAAIFRSTVCRMPPLR